MTLREFLGKWGPRQGPGAVIGALDVRTELASDLASVILAAEVAVLERLANEANCRLEHGGDLEGFEKFLRAEIARREGESTAKPQPENVEMKTPLEWADECVERHPQWQPSRNNIARTIDKAIRHERAQKEHILGLLRNTKRPHGLCQPRDRRACTACNSQEALDKILSEWKGPTIYAT